MNEDELLDLQRFTYRKSRIPALDALVTIVPAGQETDPVLQEAVGLSGFSRWFPVPGGHRLLVLYERGSYDTNRFTLEKGAWDHEHCKGCRAQIPSMTLCWVTETGPYIILCQQCHSTVTARDEGQDA